MSKLKILFNLKLITTRFIIDSLVMSPQHKSHDEVEHNVNFNYNFNDVKDTYINICVINIDSVSK